MAYAFVKLLYRSEDIFGKLPLHRVFRPVLGALLLGLVAVASELDDSQSHACRPPSRSSRRLWATAIR